MEKFTHLGMLFEIYGGLLTHRQRDVMDLYYNHDLSLAEIAEQLSISRQGVHDLVKRSGLSLENAENNIGFLKFRGGIFHGINDIERDLDRLLSCLGQGAEGEGIEKEPHELKRKLSLIKDKIMRIGDL
ncbi:MAG TPA: sigma factor-like helix-turn-helix DNA-binding protein [Clostridia bacterium]|nr:sigma factor-like helix-turn-helix DNA-binding protein [Clostridia bacterium]